MRRILTIVLTLLAATPSRADVFSFETPSGNIECSVGLGEGPSDIICEIVQTSAPPPRPRPADCSASWGHRYSMRARGPVTMDCAPEPRDLVISEKAPYGQTGSWDGITCLSDTSGLQCMNLDGHGFFLSRRSIWVK